VAGELGVVKIATAGEVVDDGGRHFGGCAATNESGEQLRARPWAAGQQVGRGQSRGRGVEDPGGTRPAVTTARYDLRAKGLGAAGLVGGGASAFFSLSFSIVISPAEKIPRTLRSKSSALVAASRAVS